MLRKMATLPAGVMCTESTSALKAIEPVSGGSSTTNRRPVHSRISRITRMIGVSRATACVRAVLIPQKATVAK